MAKRAGHKGILYVFQCIVKYEQLSRSKESGLQLDIGGFILGDATWKSWGGVVADNQLERRA